MLLPVLQDITRRLGAFLLSYGGQEIVLGDIASASAQQAGPDGDFIKNRVVLTLVSVEEENALKNNYPLRQEDTLAITRKPTLFVNLFLLFSSNFDRYDEAVKHLGYILLFFQTNTRISYTDSEGSTYSLTFSLHTIGFESLHNLWTVLGGSAKPSVVYKARLVFIQESPAGTTGVITGIKSQEQID